MTVRRGFHFWSWCKTESLCDNLLHHRLWLIRKWHLRYLNDHYWFQICIWLLYRFHSNFVPEEYLVGPSLVRTGPRLVIKADPDSPILSFLILPDFMFSTKPKCDLRSVTWSLHANLQQDGLKRDLQSFVTLCLIKQSQMRHLVTIMQTAS